MPEYLKVQHCRYGHCARVATCYDVHVIGGYRCDEHHPAGIKFPVGWDWARVESERDKWSIADNMIPVASAGGAVAWGTINSVRLEQQAAKS